MNATLLMILKMSALMLLHVGLTFLLWKYLKDKEITPPIRLGIGAIYGITAILSTHFGVDYGSMILNVRDLGPMAAGLFFDPVSGIIAGFIGGIERYIVGTYFGVGSFTRLACSLSTCLAGILAAFMNVFIFNGKKPSIAYAFFMGAVIEVFHMYVVLITHRDDMEMAFKVVAVCSVPMIVFSGAGLALASATLRLEEDEWRRSLYKLDSSEIPISHKFQVWLFGVAASMMLLSFCFSYAVQTASAEQSARDDINIVIADVRSNYYQMLDRNNRSQKNSTNSGDPTVNITIHAGRTGKYIIYDDEGKYVYGTIKNYDLKETELRAINSRGYDEIFKMTFMDDVVFCKKAKIADNRNLAVSIPVSEVYMERDRMAYETFLADILTFTVIYMLVSLLVQQLVVHNLHLVNESLRKITGGDLEEKVNVYYASEFTSLSDDINQTVAALKRYIDAAEERIKQELLLARNIQAAALPKNFIFKNPNFELYASMHPAKQVGGDFYDFFFVDQDKLALVIADVSGKGIPGAMFMMKSKTTLRGFAEGGGEPSEIFESANAGICDGNEANMFVTVWLGIIDLNTGVMKCANAGHEYPTIMRKDGEFELYKEKHSLALGAMEGMKFRQYEVQLNPGDVIYVYTDGVPEAVNREVEQYGSERMLAALNENKDKSMQELLEGVKDDIDEFVGTAEQFDDITMLGFKYNGMQK